MALLDLINSKKIIVLLGAGGVGKTTTSIAVALAAAKSGRRVALLSIDPAKRLAAALGLSLGHELKRLEFPASLNIKGCVDAAMLDQKAVFDVMVRRHAPSPQIAQKIMEQPLYKAASTNLSGPLEYMALARLQELATDPQYDLVVLDTPPDTHALDFLARPNVLAGFMENQVMTWLVKPFVFAGRLGLGKLLSVGERLMGGVAKVTGVAALRTFGDFLVLMQEVILGFHRAGEATVKLLKRSDTGFFLVSVPAHASNRSAMSMTTQLEQLGYRLDTLIFNRCLPRTVAASCEKLIAKEEESPLLKLLLTRLTIEQEIMERPPKGLSPMLYCRVDEQSRELSDLDGLMQMADSLVAAEAAFKA